jgi:hypothetical protein
MVSVLASSKSWVQPPDGSNQTIKLVFAASPLSMQHEGVRAETGWIRIRIMRPSGATCLPVYCCFKDPTEYVGQVQSRHHCHHIEMCLVSP